MTAKSRICSISLCILTHKFTSRNAVSNMMKKNNFGVIGKLKGVVFAYILFSIRSLRGVWMCVEKEGDCVTYNGKTFHPLLLV